MSYKKLSEIADIQTGLVLSRKEAKADSDKMYKYQQINLRSVDEDGGVNADTLSEYCAGEILDEQFITKESEIVMRLFSPLYPVLISKDLSGLVVPSQFSIIRVKLKNVLPAYVCSYLSQNNVLSEITAMDSGQAGRGIKISTLSNIQIPILPLQKQKTIVSLVETHVRRKKLYSELLHQYDIQADVAIKRVIGGEEI